MESIIIKIQIGENIREIKTHIQINSKVGENIGKKLPFLLKLEHECRLLISNENLGENLSILFSQRNSRSLYKHFGYFLFKQ